MTWITDEEERAEQIKAQHATEALAEAQAALDKAQTRYDAYPTSRNAYSIASGKDRVAAAKIRINDSFQTLAEFAATANGREYMDLPPDKDLLQELRTARMIFKRKNDGSNLGRNKLFKV